MHKFILKTRMHETADGACGKSHCEAQALIGKTISCLGSRHALGTLLTSRNLSSIQCCSN